MEYGVKNVFRFYDQVEKQNRRLIYVGGNVRTWQLLTDIYHFPSFQIEVASAVTATGSVAVKLVDASDDSELDVKSYFTWNTDLYIEEFTDYNYLIYNRSKNLNTNLDKGSYYLKVTAGSDVFYSELFHVKSLTGTTIVTYYSDQDVGDINYVNGTKAQFQNKLVLDTKLYKPEYVHEEEGVEDGNGNFLSTFKKTIKNYRCSFYAPEYIVDAVQLIPHHKNISVVTENGETYSETLAVVEDSFAVTETEWINQKGFAKITFEFRTEEVVTTNFASNIT